MSNTRRKLKKGERSICLGIKVLAEEYLAIKRAARRNHVSMSDYVRGFIPEATVTLILRRERVSKND